MVDIKEFFEAGVERRFVGGAPGEALLRAVGAEAEQIPVIAQLPAEEPVRKTVLRAARTTDGGGKKSP